jgi:ADP-ribose pyrophosphatase YjhB (NUDIX family)
MLTGVDDTVGGAAVDYTATLPRKRMGAGALLSDPDGRMLLVEPTYKPDWELPGGCVETDESPYAAAVREVSEELGLFVTPGRLLVVDWVPPRPPRTEGLMMIYDGGVLAAEQIRQIRLPPQELRSAAWCTLPQARQRMSAPSGRRLAEAVRARAEGTVGYLEDGHVVT